MLNAPELYKVLKIFRIFCIAGLLPIQVDVENWELRKGPAGKKWIFAVSYILFVVHALYKVVSLAYAFLFVPDVQLYQLIMHALMAMASAVVPFWYYLEYIWDPSLFATYFKATIQGNVGGSIGQRYQLKNQRRRKLREYSLQDVIAASLPYLVLLGGAIVIASYVYDPSMRLLLYAALPEHLQTSAMFMLCLVEELRFLVIIVTISTTLWQLQAISFELVSNRLQRMTQLIRDGSLSCTSVFRRIQSLQLYVSLLNNVHRQVIFTWKFTCISCCIISGYAAIAHFQEHPILGIMYYALLLEFLFVYTCMYEKAVKIPQLFQEATKCSVLRIPRSRTSCFRRQILSIPPIGIKVGRFHMMERTSLLIFMNYVLANIVNMLVAYG